MSGKKTSPELTLFAEDFLAKTSVSQDSAQDSTEQGPVFGENSQESSKKSNRKQSLLKTLRRSLVEGWTELHVISIDSVTGSLLDSSKQVMSVRRIEENDSSSWPTTTASDAKKSARHGYMLTGHTGTTLLDAVREYPTPTASSYGTSNNGCPGDGREEYAMKGKPSLTTMANRMGGYLNPEWVETLMGFPIGWTDGPLDPATPPLFGNLFDL